MTYDMFDTLIQTFSGECLTLRVKETIDCMVQTEFSVFYMIDRGLLSERPKNATYC